MFKLNPQKRARIVELAETGLYSKAEIKRLILKKFGTINGIALNKILNEEKITLPEGFGKGGAKQSIERSVYLKDYTFEDLEKDIKSGKNRQQIAQELFDKNTKYYKTLKKPRLGIKAGIAAAVGDRLVKRPELAKIDFLNLKKFKADEKLALKDVRNFIKKNKKVYKKIYASNKVGAVDGFKEKVLDYISEKYPKFLERAKGDSSGKILNNQRIFTAYNSLGRVITKQGEYGKEVALNKDIRKALGISERPSKGEGATKERLNRDYNKRTAELLKLAQKQKLIPLIDPKTGNPINSEAAYYRYINRSQIDPIRNLFGKKYKFGQEHVGGITRGTIVSDPKVLTQITAMDPYQNKYVKGANFDKKTATQLRLAKQSSTEKAKKYLKIQNELINQSDKKFGLDSTRQKLVNNEIKTIYPKSSLEDSFLKKAQRAIKTFIATGRDREPAFKTIDPYLQKAIKIIKKTGSFSPSTNSLLNKALKRTGVAGLVGMIGVGMFSGGSAEASEITQPQRPQVIEKPETIQYNRETGSFLNTATEDKTDQNQLLQWGQENPLTAVAGTSVALSAQEIPRNYKMRRGVGDTGPLPGGKGRIRSSIGIGGALKPVLTTLGTPLIGLGFEGLMAKERLENDESMSDILMDPLGPAASLAFMEPLSRSSGVVRGAPTGIKNYFKNYGDLSNVGQARPGLTSKALRLGLSPRMIAGASRFLGLPGLALTTGLAGYNAYKNYQNEEGMIYNFFNNNE